MNKPEWGAMFFDEAVEHGAVMYWGARGAIVRGRLELYPDRQSFTADDVEHKQEFVEWINDRLIPHLEQRVKKHDTARIFVSNADGSFQCRAEDRNSGGYLYIGAWMQNVED